MCVAEKREEIILPKNCDVFLFSKFLFQKIGKTFKHHTMVENLIFSHSWDNSALFKYALVFLIVGGWGAIREGARNFLFFVKFGGGS